jgi:hypothetical protein
MPLGYPVPGAGITGSGVRCVVRDGDVVDLLHGRTGLGRVIQIDLAVIDVGGVVVGVRRVSRTPA